MNDLPATNKNPKLPIKRILILSFKLIQQRILTFIRMGLPLLLIVSIVVIINLFYSTTDGQHASPIYIYLMLLLIWVVLVMVIIGCHRSFLMNETKIQQTKTFRWQAREWKFLGWGILVGLAIGIMYMIWGAIIPFTGLIHIGNPVIQLFIFQLLLLPITYIFSRWSLVFPATAIEDPDASLSDAWLLSEGNGWRLTFLIALVPLIFDLLFSFIFTYDSVIFNIIFVLVWLVIAVYQIGLLSLSYAFLKGNFKSDNEIVI